MEDSFVTLDAILAELEQLSSTGLERQQRISELDLSSRRLTQLLAEQYVEARRLTTEQEARMWDLGNRLHAGFSRAYEQVLNEMAGAAPASEYRRTLIGRAFYHHGREAIWFYFRYTPLPSGWWKNLHKLYLYAEQENLATQFFALYPEEAACSCAALYIRILLMETINRTNLSTIEIETIYNWLMPWATQIKIDEHYNERVHLFFVNLDEDRGGRRIRNLEQTASCRYWNPSPIVHAISEALDELVAFNPLLSGLETSVIHQLNWEWSRNAYLRQRRTCDRNSVSKHASVAHGIYAVCQDVRNMFAGNVEPQPEGVLWQIINESLFGFGAIINTELNDWVKIGRLISLREAMNPGTSIVGVVRNLEQLDDDSIRVGVEVFSHISMYGVLHESQNNAPDQLAFPSIYLSSDENRGLPPSLLIPANEYRQGMQMHLLLDRVLHPVKLQEVLEQKDDWVRVRVEVLDAPA